MRAARALAAFEGRQTVSDKELLARRRLVAAPPAAPRSARRGGLRHARRARHRRRARAMTSALGPWDLACLAAAMIALDPARPEGRACQGACGACARPLPGAGRRLDAGRSPTGASRPGISDARLTGGLDIGASLEAGRPVVETGVLAAADGGVLVVSHGRTLAAVRRGHHRHDDGQRCGLAASATACRAESPARFALLALDEGDGDDEPLVAADRRPARPARRLDGIPLRDLDGTPARSGTQSPPRRALLSDVTIDDAMTETLCRIAMAFGGRSMRQTLFLQRAARAAAALRASPVVETEDALLAARLVFGASLSPAEPEQRSSPRTNSRTMRHRSPNSPTRMAEKPKSRPCRPTT